MSVEITELAQPKERSRAAAEVLAELHEWFGIASAREAYVRDVAGLPTWAAHDEGRAVGFLSLKLHGPRAAEVYVMGVLPDHHGRGIGTALLEAAERHAALLGVTFLQVKTLGPSRPSRRYGETRRFYAARGFTELEEIEGLWEEGNPCLLLVKELARGLRVVPVTGLPEVREGDDLAELVLGAAALEDGDVLVLAQKAVSKSEGRVVRLADVQPSERARKLAGDDDPRRLEVILREAASLVRTRPPLVIAETRHGFVCASAGVDSSNAPEAGTLVLLPLDPDASAVRVRQRLAELTGLDVGVVVTDSFGRPWRQGTTDVAIGCAGITPLVDLRGRRDRVGYELHATQIAVADEIAGAAELAMGKTGGIPAAIVRGVHVAGDGTARDLVMPRDRDLFR